MIIRNTPSLRQASSNRTLSRLRAELDRQTEVATSGLEVLDPSDAPGEWQQLHGLQESLDNQDVYLTNARNAKATLDTLDSALAGASDVLVRAHELAVQLSSEIYTDSDRDTAAFEVDLLKDQLIAQANTRHDDRYLFAGTAYDGRAFDDAGVYLGTNDQTTTQTGDHHDIPIGYDGAAVFSDAIGLLTDLGAALRSGPGSAGATAATLDPLAAGHDAMVISRQRAGHAHVDAQDAEELALNLTRNLQDSLNARAAADPISALTKLAELQTAYETALQVTAQTSSSNLFEYLR